MFRHLVIIHSIIFYNLGGSQPCRRKGNCIPRTGTPDSDEGGPGGTPSGAIQPLLTTDDGKPRKRCCPYDFDSTRCKVLDDRVLCGFNRNWGSPQSRDNIKELSDGCRLRGGRLECGYVQEPYHNVRRPPAWDNPPDGGDRNAYTGNNVGAAPSDSVEFYDNNNQKLYVKKSAKYTKNINMKQQPICVEVGARIVCKPIT